MLSQLGVGMLDVLLLPLLVLTATLEVGDEWVKGDGLVVMGMEGRRGEGVVGAELEAAMAVLVVVGGGFLWGSRD